MKRLTPNERIIGWRLATGAIISKEELFDALYANDTTGGPDSAENIISILIHRLRRKSGILIFNKRFKGWSIQASDIEKLKLYLIQEFDANGVFAGNGPASFKWQYEKRLRQNA